MKAHFADVVLEDGIIQEIKEAKTAKITSEKDVIDLTGKTLLPGLIEAHLHLDLCGMNVYEENVQQESYRMMRALRLAQDNLKMGYTTVRDLGDRNNLVIGIARAVKEGLIMRPDILASGKILSPTEAGNDYFEGMYAEVDSPDAYTQAVRRQYQAGADWIKIMGTGAVMNPGGEPGKPIIFEKELRAACEAASYTGLPVAVHCHGTEGIKMCICCGVRTVEHSTLIDEECIRMYKASDQTFPIPTMSPMVAFTEHPEGKPIHYVEKGRQSAAKLIEGLQACREAGIKIGWGSDAGVYENSHGNGLYGFRARVERAGFTPLECLIQATKNNAEILGISDTVGTISCGKKANLVAFDGNPDENIEALAQVSLVLKAGVAVHLS
ncbi:MAG: amidohydrolase family protein [Lachnospiraceae bacterium]|nr:amidohydrolase family protein [Lachnospiraceae bacterium]